MINLFISSANLAFETTIVWNGSSGYTLSVESWSYPRSTWYYCLRRAHQWGHVFRGTRPKAITGQPASVLAVVKCRVLPHFLYLLRHDNSNGRRKGWASELKDLGKDGRKNARLNGKGKVEKSLKEILGTGSNWQRGNGDRESKRKRMSRRNDMDQVGKQGKQTLCSLERNRYI